MNDLKSLYKQKNYQINSLVLKSIKGLNLSLAEFLLILYFINEEASLNLEGIKESLGLTEEEILNTYSDLISKGIIEIIVSKENGKVTEKISLELFYDKLVLSSSKENNKVSEDIYSKFENEFGRTLSPIEYETINNWLNNGVSEETIVSALKEAVIQEVPKLRYIDKIIYEWTKKTKKPEDEEYKELFDYDWLGVSNE